MRLLQLDALRFFALLLIVLSHFEFLKGSSASDFYFTYLHNPTLGVDFFFILTGFGLVFSRSEKTIICGFAPSVKFAISRMKKIYFPYVISLILGLIGIILLEHGSVANAVIKFFFDLTLLQSVTGSTCFSHGINGVCWFLSTLFMCYIIAPTMMIFVKKNCSTTRKCIVFAIITFIIILLLTYLFSIVHNQIPFFDDLSYGSVYIRLFYVFLGMLLATVFKHSQNKINIGKIEFAVVSIGIIWFFLRNSCGYFINEKLLILRFVDILVAMFFFIFAYGQGFFSRKLKKSTFPIKWGGTYGLYLYLFHYPIRKIVDGLVSVLEINRNALVYFGEVAVIVVATFIMSIFIKKINDVILGTSFKKLN